MKSFVSLIITWVWIGILLLGCLIGICGVMYVVMSSCIPFIQVVKYLISGYWDPHSIAHHIGWNHPNSWYGLHTVLDSLNVAFMFPLIVPCFVFTAYCGSLIAVHLDDPEKEAQERSRKKAESELLLTDIIAAAQSGAKSAEIGIDQNTNLPLKHAVQKAKAANVSETLIMQAMSKGHVQGISDIADQRAKKEHKHSGTSEDQSEPSA